MEPPAKRLRILQSVEVDDTNPDYIAAKEKQRAKLKGKFEALFSKYEALPEAMTDEIDMRTGEIVVDRGHMRRLNREYMRRQGRRGNRTGQLLDDLIGGAPEDATDDDESSEEDPRDELAPSQSPEPRNRRQDAPKNGPLPTLEARGIHTSPSQPTTQVDIPPPYTPAGAAIASSTQASVPNASSPAANWMQLVQFPQTPAGQLAQSAFMQQITQAVQQAITPILSNILSGAPRPSQEAANKITRITSTTIDDKVPLATTPILQSPPPAESSDLPVAAQSSPLPVSASSPRRRRFFAKGVYVSARRDRRCLPPAPRHDTTLDPVDVQNLRAPEMEDSPSNADESRGDGPDNIAPKRHRHDAPKYAFTEEDDHYIIEQRTLSKRSWVDIRESRSKWTDWPLFTFHNHWKALKRKVLDLGNTEESGGKTDMKTIQPQEKPRLTRSRKEGKQALIFPALEVVNMSSPTTPHHLPTPSSLEHDEAKDLVEQSEDLATEDIEILIASGGHFDEDERDLLSLAGTDDHMDGSQVEEFGTCEVIIPSIETEVPANYGAAAKHTSTVPDISGAIPKPEAPLPVTSTTMIPSSPKKSRKTLKPINFQVNSDSEDDLDLVDADSPSVEGRFDHNTCKKPFKTSRSLKHRQDNPSNEHALTAPEVVDKQTPSGEADDLLAPATYRIKREPCTPPSNFLLATPTLHTPRSAPQPITRQSSGAKANSTPMARSIFLKKVKQSWAMNGRKSTPGPKTSLKPKSFEPVKRKRAWDDGDSGDELAV